MCNDGKPMEIGKALGVGHCAKHGTVTIIGHRKNGESVGFQLSAAEMLEFASLLQDQVCLARGLPADHGREQQSHFDITNDGRVITLPAWRRDLEAIEMRLLMASIEVSKDDIASWTDEQCKAADCWAIAVHYSASDNDGIQVPEKPTFLPPEKSFSELHS